MTYKQVKFRIFDADIVECKRDALGGIAYYESKLDKTPKYIICGCCGGIFEPEDFETAPGKTDNFMIIELTIFPGRTKEQKKNAIEMITANLNKNLNIEPTDIFIIMNEPPLENWGMGGRQKC